MDVKNFVVYPNPCEISQHPVERSILSTWANSRKEEGRLLSVDYIVQQVLLRALFGKSIPILPDSTNNAIHPTVYSVVEDFSRVLFSNRVVFLSYAGQLCYVRPLTAKDVEEYLSFISTVIACSPTWLRDHSCLTFRIVEFFRQHDRGSALSADQLLTFLAEGC